MYGANTTTHLSHQLQKRNKLLFALDMDGGVILFILTYADFIVISSKNFL